MVFGFEVLDLLLFAAISLGICVFVCMLAMEAAVLFTPAFIFLFPLIIFGFPSVSANEAIGLAITIEFFGYSSSVLAYWLRGQVDPRLALKMLSLTIPLAIAGRVAAFLVAEEGLLVVFGAILIGLAGVMFLRNATSGSMHAERGSSADIDVSRVHLYGEEAPAGVALFTEFKAAEAN